MRKPLSTIVIAVSACVWSMAYAETNQSAQGTTGQKPLETSLLSANQKPAPNVETTPARAPGFAFDRLFARILALDPLRVSLVSPPKAPTFGWEENSTAQYATYRSGGNVYFKGKAGYVWNDDVDDLSKMSFSDIMGSFDNKGAVGVGAGYKLTNGEVVEIEYTINKRDERIVSIGYTF